MYLKSLFLKNFRNYEETYVEFSKGLNYIYGGNAEGKTNLLEAIFLISSGKSFRTIHFSDLIRTGSQSCTVAAEIEKEGISQTIEMTFNGLEKQLKLNATMYKNFAPLLGLLPHVLLIPEAIRFIHGAPLERRRFLDFHLAQSNPLYVHHYLRFAKAMKHRNQLLRNEELATIDGWEEIMAHSAAYLIAEREMAINALAPYIRATLEELSEQKEELLLLYKPNFASSPDFITRFQERLKRLRNREIILGYTLTGPHRDDLQLLISGKEARDFASEGQKRSCLAALCLAEWTHLHRLTSQPPLFSIDDFAIHLDKKRQSFLEQKIDALGQVFLTSPHPPEDRMAQHSINVLHL
jgi:DNA replication and repair protein RecF